MKNRRAGKAISQIAKKHHVSEDTVREEIRKSIADAMQSSDPEVQKLWKQILCAGEVPEPEEVMEWIAKQICN